MAVRLKSIRIAQTRPVGLPELWEDEFVVGAGVVNVVVVVVVVFVVVVGAGELVVVVVLVLVVEVVVVEGVGVGMVVVVVVVVGAEVVLVLVVVVVVGAIVAGGALGVVEEGVGVDAPCEALSAKADSAFSATGRLS
jgi:hypothetical protein